MKYIKIFIFAMFMVPVAALGAGDFQTAAQLLAAAKNADIQQVQSLVNNGADINFVDNTGLSIVCTALMNNDVRAAQILQMYGADASKCDQQIKRYNQKLPKEESGGLFSGLSSAQSIALAAAGAAVVIGGVLLLADAFDSDNGNGGASAGNQCRPNAPCTCANGDSGKCKSDGTCDCSDGGTGTETAKITLPYGPAMPNAASETANYGNNLNYYSTNTIAPILQDNFKMMTDGYGYIYKVGNTEKVSGQNYLLMMHGYSPLARGYMGQRTLRDRTSREPFTKEEVASYTLAGASATGGRPVNVALVTDNGINAATNSSLADKIMVWTTEVAPDKNISIASKYYNNEIIRPDPLISIDDCSTNEDLSGLADFDFSNSGTAINNALATEMDNLLAQVVAGRDAGYADADFMGFMPNGQLTVYRTGGGSKMVNVSNPAIADGFMDVDGDEKLSNNDTLALYDKTLTVKIDKDTGLVKLNVDDDTLYYGYVGADGYLYVDSDGAGKLQAYEFNGISGDLKLVKEQVASDYYNYRALVNALNKSHITDGDKSGGKSRVDVIANADVIAPLRGRDVETISDVLSFASSDGSTSKTAELRRSEFLKYINKYYNYVDTDGTGGKDVLPSVDADSFFSSLGGASYTPLAIFSTGAFETDSNWSGRTMEATFENSAPLIFIDSFGNHTLEHLFMSVVAVSLSGTGTTGTTDVTAYSPSGKIALSQWADNNGTTDITTDDKYYKARVCGAAGTGASGLDPWCFAAAGLTDELAVSSMAGAAGAIKSAFEYMNNKQIFSLLALTADGPFLATKPDGKAMSVDELLGHLQSMYILPTEYQHRIDKGGEDYFKVFKEVFGYGLVNLERATKPTSKIYYYLDGDIVSGNGNAYWRAATNTAFRTSGAMNIRAASISAPFYDVLESSDGTLSLPRVWNNEFTIGATDARGLYMGDVLGEFRVTRDNLQKTQFGNMSLEMAFSNRAYTDNMAGLDKLQFGYETGNWDLTAGYQRYFTDGASRFYGTANPILSMAANTVSTDAVYKFGNWSFGARAFSGSVTDESLLENDPTVSSQYEPMKLGLIQGGAGSVSWGNDKFGIMSAIGVARETDTVLGAYTDGLLNMGAGNTTYIDTVATYNPMENITLSARSTFAKTTANPSGEFILGLTDINSNAFSIAADIGNWSFAVSRPLAATSGSLKYAHTEYDIVENDAGNYDLNVTASEIRDLDITPQSRELRLSGSYRTKFGPHTDGAFGFIYRINPNHVKEFGNESILMMKFTHKVGI